MSLLSGLIIISTIGCKDSTPQARIESILQTYDVTTNNIVQLFTADFDAEYVIKERDGTIIYVICNPFDDGEVTREQRIFKPEQ